MGIYKFRRKRKWETLEAAGAADSEGIILVHARCIKQLALSAERNAKFHSSQQTASQFIAKNVMPKEEATDSI
jgi:hypothetical protein